jgi:hypothetical protein
MSRLRRSRSGSKRVSSPPDGLGGWQQKRQPASSPQRMRRSGRVNGARRAPPGFARH